MRIQVERHDGRRIRYRPLQDLVNRLYPGRWAVMSFPSEDHLFDDVNRYHLLVFEAAPDGFDFFASPPLHTVALEPAEDP